MSLHDAQDKFAAKETPIKDAVSAIERIYDWLVGHEPERDHNGDIKPQ